MGRKKAKTDQAAQQEERNVDLDQLIESAEKESTHEHPEEAAQQEETAPKVEASDDATEAILKRYEERLAKAEEASRLAESRALEAERKAHEQSERADRARKDVMNEVEEGLMKSSSQSSTTEDGALAAQIAKHAPELVHQIPYLRNLISKDLPIAPVLREDSGDACGDCNRQVIDKQVVGQPDKNPRYEIKYQLTDSEKGNCKPNRMHDVYIIKFVRGRAHVPHFIADRLVAMKPAKYAVA